MVTLRYSDRAVVLDARSDEEVTRVPVPYYTEAALWAPSGRRVFLTNRWKDAVLYWDVDTSDGFEVTRTNYAQEVPSDPFGIPVGDNPGPMAISEDGERLFVGAVAGCTIAVVDARAGALVDVDDDPATTTRGAPSGVSHLDFHSPVGGLLVHGSYLYVTDVGGGLGQYPAEGSDLDEDGRPGDGTANVVFQDLSNEIGVVHTKTLKEVHRYTADSTCCMDYRDVDPDAPERGLRLPAPDTWAPDVVPFLAPRDTWIVRGALPEAMAMDGGTLWVAYPGSNEVQGFRVGERGALSPRPGPLLRTGYNPKDLAVTARGLVTVDRLAESLSFLDPSGGARETLGEFPATDAELGEGINEMTAAFGVDGDQTCVHCHRDNGAIARPVIMPLQLDRRWGRRNVMAQRGLYDTRPWFVESSMNENNFFPVLNEFARKENFCCEGLDPTVWDGYPTATECLEDEGLAGCNHVLRCSQDPPPECAERPYGEALPLRRAEFVKAAARALFGRDTTFGDALYRETPDGERAPIALDFEGITRAIGLFMLRTPRLLPNPNAALDLPTARRGARLFEEAAVGCVFCHPLPNATTSTQPEHFSPFGAPVRFPAVITPTLDPEGHDASLVNERFLGTFPQTLQDGSGLRLGATPLRGLWDRPQTRFYHDGRARSLREALATPGHPALGEGETGHNERRGVLDTHGGTSHLDRYQLEDLMNFLLTL